MVLIIKEASYLLLPKEAYLTDIHVCCFFQIPPWCVDNINIVHFASCKKNTVEIIPSKHC